MFGLTYEGVRWGFAFIKTDGRLTLDQKDYLVEEAVSMYLEDVERKIIINDDFEGIIYTEGKKVNLGSIVGQMFDAKIDANDGKAHISFVINEMSRRDHREVGALN